MPHAFWTLCRGTNAASKRGPRGTNHTSKRSADALIAEALAAAFAQRETPGISSFQWLHNTARVFTPPPLQ
jgi:hypothetical protein